MEQRRIIGYILLALAAVICLASNVWFIVKMPMGGEKVSHLIFRTLPEVIALLTVVYIFVRQGKSVNLKLDTRERRLKLDESNAIDSYGYSYIMMGAMSVFVTLMFAVDITWCTPVRQDFRWMVYRCIECLDGCIGAVVVGENRNG